MSCVGRWSCRYRRYHVWNLSDEDFPLNMNRLTHQWLTLTKQIWPRNSHDRRIPDVVVWVQLIIWHWLWPALRFHLSQKSEVRPGQLSELENKQLLTQKRSFITYSFFFYVFAGLSGIFAVWSAHIFTRRSRLPERTGNSQQRSETRTPHCVPAPLKASIHQSQSFSIKSTRDHTCDTGRKFIHSSHIIQTHSSFIKLKWEKLH